MKDFEKLDELLWNAMDSDVEPDESLNQKIIEEFNRRAKMKVGNKKRMPVMVMVAIFVLVMSVSVFAVWKLLTPVEIAEKLENKSLANAFKGEDALIINQSQISGDYEISLMGIVSGKDISEFEHSTNGIVNSDRSYAVVSIGKADGTQMPDMDDPEYDKIPFFVSPYIKGQNPREVNIITMNGGYGAFLEDGIWYKIIECDNIEIFADRGLYLGVTSSTFYDVEAYDFNLETGEITPNEDYEGVNILFDLPLDPAKANYEKAEKYLQELLDKDKSEEGSNNMEHDDVEILLEGAILIPESVQEIVPDKEGMVTYGFDKFETRTPVEVLFDDEDQTGFSECFYVDEKVIDDELIINFIVFSKDKKGIIKGMTYRKK